MTRSVLRARVSTMRFPMAAGLLAVGLSGCGGDPAPERENTWQVQDRLFAIGVCSHEHQETHGALHDPKQQHGWRIVLLPYMEQQGPHRKISMAKSPREASDIAKSIPVPPIYRTPNTPAGKTRYRVFAGPGTVFDPERRVTMSDISRHDGTANTILVVLAGPEAAIEWGENKPLPFDPENPEAAKKALGTIPASGFLVLKCDGSVQKLSRDIDAKVFAGMLTWNGDELPYVP